MSPAPIPAGRYSWIADGTLGLAANTGVNLGGELDSSTTETVNVNQENIYTLTYNAGQTTLQRTSPTGPTLTATDTTGTIHNVNNLFVSSSLDMYAEWEVCGLGQFINFLSVH